MAIVQQFVQPRTVYIEKETTNQSFLDMHYYLKSKGIQNNDFFLVLLDTDLRGVDPADPTLPNHMRIKVLNEIRNNYWYFLRNVLRFPIQGGDTSKGKRYRLDRAGIAINFLFILNYNAYIIIPRQLGKTSNILARMLWVYNFGTTNSEIMFIHKDHGGSKKNLRDLKAMRDILPSYLRFDSAVNTEGKKLKVPNTIVNIQHPYNNNKITTFPSARTKESANNLGRGSTMPLQFYDEFAFMPYNKEVYLAAAPAFSTASDNARSMGAPYGMVLATTPGDLLTDSGIYAFDMLNKATPWKEEYYDMTYEQLEGLRKANTKSSFFSIVYSYKQLGKGNDYFMKMAVELNNEWPAIRREILLEWAETTTNCPFSQEDLDKIKQHLKEPMRTIFYGKFNQYQMNIYENIDTAYPPIIGVDVAGATFNDSSAITIIDSHTTRVCATLNCNFIPYDDLADVIYQVVSRWLPNAVINIERNGGFGVAVIQRLAKTSVKKNMYWEIKDKVIEEAFDGFRMQKRARKVKVYGLNSTKDVRARLIDILRERVMYHKDKFVAPILHSEMSAMEVKKNGKVEHSANSHDDQVFSYLMALYVWYDGKDLAQNFGIMKNTLRTDDSEELEELGFEDQLEKRNTLDVKILENDETEFDKQLAKDLEWLNHDVKSFKTSEQLQDEIIADLRNRKRNMVQEYPFIHDAIVEETGIDDMMMNKFGGNTFTVLPDGIYNLDDDFDSMYAPTPGGVLGNDAAHQIGNGPKVVGNLSGAFKNLF